MLLIRHKKATHLAPAALGASANCSVSRLLLTSKTDDYAASGGEDKQEERE